VTVIFSVYDEDGNGFIEQDEMVHLLSCLFNKSAVLLADVRKTLNLPDEHNSQEIIAQSEIEKIVQKCFEQADENNDKKISKEEFGKWLSNQPSVIAWLSPGVTKI